MATLKRILEETLKQLQDAGVPKQSETANNYFIRLFKAILSEMEGQIVSKSDTLYLNRILSQWKKTSRLADYIEDGVPTEFVITKASHKALSQKMFFAAQSLQIGDVSGWKKLCQSAETKYKCEGGGNLPRAYTQTKSNIKRMITAKMDLATYKSESKARAALHKKV